MRRGGDAERYLELLERRARARRPTSSCAPPSSSASRARPRRTSRTCSSSSRAREFDHLGAFVYSPEEGTPAAALPGRVPRGDGAAAPGAAARGAGADRPGARAAALVGQRLRALVEGACEESEHLLQGRHHGMAPEIDGRLLINDGIARRRDAGRGRDHRRLRRRPGRAHRRAAPAPPGVDARASPTERPAPCSSFHDALRSTDLPRGGIATIGNYDGVHRGQRASSTWSVARARGAGAAADGHHLRAAPAHGAAPREAPPLLTTQAQKERLLDEAGIEVVLVVRFTPEFSPDAGAHLRARLPAPAAGSARRSTSARASSSATGARATWRCCASSGATSASPPSASRRCCTAASRSRARASAARARRATSRRRGRCSAGRSRSTA